MSSSCHIETDQLILLDRSNENKMPTEKDNSAETDSTASLSTLETAPASAAAPSNGDVEESSPGKPVEGNLITPAGREDAKIRFDMASNKEKVFEQEYEDGEEDQIWFTGDDYIRFKSASREESRAWRRYGYGILLQDSFESPVPNIQDHLNAFCRLEGDMSRRGLERNLSRQHAEERSDRKDRARRVVMVTQERLGRRGIKGIELSDRIAQVYQHQNTCAHMFAQRIALADEAVVKLGEDSKEAERLLEESGGNKYSKMERRLSSVSQVSTGSVDSRRRWVSQKIAMGQKAPTARRLGSPATPAEEYYAAIA